MGPGGSLNSQDLSAFFGTWKIFNQTFFFLLGQQGQRVKAKVEGGILFQFLQEGGDTMR